MGFSKLLFVDVLITVFSEEIVLLLIFVFVKLFSGILPFISDIVCVSSTFTFPEIIILLLWLILFIFPDRFVQPVIIKINRMIIMTLKIGIVGARGLII